MNGVTRKMIDILSIDPEASVVLGLSGTWSVNTEIRAFDKITNILHVVHVSEPTPIAAVNAFWETLTHMEDHHEIQCWSFKYTWDEMKLVFDKWRPAPQ